MDKILCTCSKCRKNGPDNIGNYVHPTTKWRHVKNEKRKYNLGLNDGNDDVEFNRFV
jgi:hypothetical protein